MQIKNIYIADDGTEFNNEGECVAYETQCRKTKSLLSQIKAWNAENKQLDTSCSNWFYDAEYIEFRSTEAMHTFAGILMDGTREDIDAYEPELGRYLIELSEPTTMIYFKEFCCGTGFMAAGWFDISLLLKTIKDRIGVDLKGES